MRSSIFLSFGTLMYCGKSCTKFGANPIKNYGQLFASEKANLLSCLHGKSLMYRLTIIAQTFCGIKEIVLTAIELQGKNQITVNHGVEIF